MGWRVTSLGRTINRCLPCLNSIRGNGWCTKSLEHIFSRRTLCGWSRLGRCSCQTREFCRSYGSCIRAIRILLAASLEQPSAGEDWVRKPLLGREGGNVTLHRAGRDVQTGGDYGEEGFVYQDVAPLKSFDGMYPVIGSWVIGHEAGNCAAGIGIRESETPITTNMSRFVPHVCG